MTERDEYTPEGWTPEAWQKLMDTDVAVAYRLMESGLVLDPNDKPHDPVEVARIDAEYNAWLAAHDEAVRQEERERCAQIADRLHGVGNDIIAARIRAAGGRSREYE